MPRAIWKGDISFGLVHIPVGLYPAENKDRIELNLLDRRDMTPIRYRRVNEETEEEVPWEEIVRGYQTDDGQYVVLTDDDLKAANVEATQTIGIVDFVDLDDIHPLFFDRPYYLAPTGKKAHKSYALLREALRRSGKVGIAKVVIRTRQYLAAVVARGEVLTLELLRFAHELREPEELELPGDDLEALGVRKQELELAERLIDGMVTEWRPESYRDDYREDLLALIEKKIAAGGREVVEAPAEREEPKGAEVIDLMALLKKSVKESGGEAKKKPAKSRAKKPARKAGTAKKSSSRKSA